jgi:tetratricopeptide (TPR) repeat protein
VRRALLALGLLVLQAPAQVPDELQLADERGVTVSLRFGKENSDPLLTVRGTDVSLEVVVRAIANRLLINDVVGFGEIDRSPRVTVNLVDQPAHHALRWILGSAGLSVHKTSNSLVVREDVGTHPDGRAMLRKAGARYFDALKRFPDYPLADRGEMARAEILERLGPEEYGRAAMAYDELIEAYPTSLLMPEALLRSARMRGKLDQWPQAVLRYEQLADMLIDHPLHSLARRELANALCKVGEATADRDIALGSGEKAIYVLDALDTNYPTQEPGERYARLLVYARAHALAGRPMESLRSLTAAERYSRAGSKDPVLLELRALALARADEHGAASTAWLAFAEELVGVAREDAFVRAAREALLAGEEVAVLLMEGRAQSDGFGERLAPAAAEARARLGLPVEGLEGLDAKANLARGEAHLAARRWEAAASALGAAYRTRAELDPDQQVRLGQAYARALHRGGHPEAAIDTLRVIVAGLAKESRRRPLYLLASDLYEERGQLDMAIKAINGRL